MKKVKIRRITVLLGVVIVFVSLIANVGTGSLSSFGWESIAYICPLGSLEILLASKMMIPRVVITIIVVLILTVLLGRIFCSWICPAPPVKRFLDNLFHRRRGRNKDVVLSDDRKKSTSCEDASPNSDATDSAFGNTVSASQSCSACSASSSTRRFKFDSRYVVLLAALIASLIFGFPVFCLFCPVGLLLGLIVAVWFMLTEATVNFSLLIIPIVVILELTVLRSWCQSFCPLGALFSLFSIPNRFFRPHVNKSICLQENGIPCNRCSNACEENLDPHTSVRMNNCTKCGLCQTVCPMNAISFPVFNKTIAQIDDMNKPNNITDRVSEEELTESVQEDSK